MRQKLILVGITPQVDDYLVVFRTRSGRRYSVTVSEYVLLDRRLFMHHVRATTGKQFYAEDDDALWHGLVRFRMSPRVREPQHKELSGDE
jgi:hypothetical protein